MGRMRRVRVLKEGMGGRRGGGDGRRRRVTVTVIRDSEWLGVCEGCVLVPILCLIVSEIFNLLPPIAPQRTSTDFTSALLPSSRAFRRGCMGRRQSRGPLWKYIN